MNKSIALAILHTIIGLVSTAATAGTYYTVVSGYVISPIGDVAYQKAFRPDSIGHGELDLCSQHTWFVDCEFRLYDSNVNIADRFMCDKRWSLDECVERGTRALIERRQTVPGKKYHIEVADPTNNNVIVKLPTFEITKGYDSCVIATSGPIVDGGTRKPNSGTFKITSPDMLLVTCVERTAVRIVPLHDERDGMRIFKIGKHVGGGGMWMDQGLNRIPVELHVYPNGREPGPQQASAVLRMTIN